MYCPECGRELVQDWKRHHVRNGAQRGVWRIPYLVCDHCGMYAAPYDGDGRTAERISPQPEGSRH